MDELEILTKRVEELESLVKGLFGGDERVVRLSGIPVASLVLGKGCQVTMNSCPTGSVFFGDQDAIDEAESRLETLNDQADELDDKLDELEDRLEHITSCLEDSDK